MTSWLPDIDERQGPKYLRIADAIEDAIQSETLAPDTKLPPMRNLAYDLGVTLGTVSRAYQEAERRGLVGGEIGRGTYVKGDGRYPRPKAPRAFALGGQRDNGINLSMAVPPLGDGGVHLTETLKEISSEPALAAELVDYQPHSGLARHRQAGADWAARVGIKTDVESVTLANGTQHAIMVSLMALTRPGDTVLTECITYPGVIHLCAQLGLKLLPVEIDDEGILPDSLRQAIETQRPRALYTCPTIQNPTTAIMSHQRRLEIAEILQSSGLLTIEDDVWGFLPADRPPALATYAPEQIIHVTGLSKAMAPGLRVGYITSPPGATDAIRTVARMSSWMVPPLMAEVAYRWLNSNLGDEMINWQRKEAEARMKIAVDALGDQVIRGHQNSYQIWMELPEPWRGDAFRREAEARGVYFLSGESFSVGRQPAPHAARMCVGSCRTRAEVKEGFEILADILERSTPAAQVVA